MNDIENSYDEHVPTTMDDMKIFLDELRGSKRQRKRFPLEMIFILS